MAKKEKPQNIEKIVKKVNKKFAKTSQHIESLLSDALKRFDHLQSQIQEPVHKLCKEIDELRDREMKRFNDEFERRLHEFQEMQNSLLERLGLGPADKETPDDQKPVLMAPSEAAPSDSVSPELEAPELKAPELKTPKSKTSKSKSPKSKTAKKTKSETADAPAPAPAEAPKELAETAVKTPAKTKPKATRLADPSDLTRVKGIGPATQKKMKEAGLTTIGQIAYPSAEDEEKLKEFAGIKGFDQLSSEAKKIV